MMNSSIDDGGFEFRGTEATLKINRSGFGVYRKTQRIHFSQRAASAMEPSSIWRISSSTSSRVRSRTHQWKPVLPQRAQVISVT
jgi:hypothetical protein